MRKALTVISSLFLASLITTHNSQAAEVDDSKTLRLYNWADYIGENTLAEFEKATGIKVIYDTFDAYETVQAKLLTGHSGYDLVVLNASLAPPLIKAKVFQPLNKKLLPGWANLDHKVLEDMQGFDAGNLYSAPYTWGSNGITYNVDKIKERMPDAPIGSLAMIFDPKIVSRFADCGVTLVDAPTEVIPLALKYLGRDPRSAAPADLKAAQELLLSVRPYIRKFDSVNYLTSLPNGDTCMAMTWSGDYATAMARAEEAKLKINLSYFIPKEGSLIWFDNMYIPADAPHVANAHKFLDFLMKPQVMADVTDYIHYANSNAAATPLLDADVRNNPAIYPDDETRERLFAQKTQDPKDMRAITRVWSTVKSGI
ncbi:polyamine ABC transporter substrate-binding protein [Pseudomonas sp. S2_C03]